MEQEFNTPYKSNYSLGIFFTIVSLLAVLANIISLMMPAISCVVSLLSTLAFILLMVWFYRSHKNLLSFNSMGLKYSPGWAVGSFFVPILNFFRPYQIAQEIWTASDPEVSTVGWKQAKIGVVVIFWWLSVLSYYVVYISSIGTVVSQGIQTQLAGIEPDIAALSNSISIPIIIAYAVYAILSISLVVLINDRQDEKAESLTAE